MALGRVNVSSGGGIKLLGTETISYTAKEALVSSDIKVGDFVTCDTLEIIEPATRYDLSTGITSFYSPIFISLPHDFFIVIVQNTSLTNKNLLCILYKIDKTNHMIEYVSTYTGIGNTSLIVSTLIDCIVSDNNVKIIFSGICDNTTIIYTVVLSYADSKYAVSNFLASSSVPGSFERACKLSDGLYFVITSRLSRYYANIFSVGNNGECYWESFNLDINISSSTTKVVTMYTSEKQSVKDLSNMMVILQVHDSGISDITSSYFLSINKSTHSVSISSTDEYGITIPYQATSYPSNRANIEYKNYNITPLVLNGSYPYGYAVISKDNSNLVYVKQQVPSKKDEFVYIPQSIVMKNFLSIFSTTPGSYSSTIQIEFAKLFGKVSSIQGSISTSLTSKDGSKGYSAGRIFGSSNIVILDNANSLLSDVVVFGVKPAIKKATDTNDIIGVVTKMGSDGSIEITV